MPQRLSESFVAYPRRVAFLLNKVSLLRCCSFFSSCCTTLLVFADQAKFLLCGRFPSFPPILMIVLSGLGLGVLGGCTPTVLWNCHCLHLYPDPLSTNLWCLFAQPPDKFFFDTPFFSKVTRLRSLRESEKRPIVTRSAQTVSNANNSAAGVIARCRGRSSSSHLSKTVRLRVIHTPVPAFIIVLLPALFVHVRSLGSTSRKIAPIFLKIRLSSSLPPSRQIPSPEATLPVPQVIIVIRLCEVKR